MAKAQRWRRGTWGLAALLVATGAAAQPSVHSFDELQRTLRVGETVFVTETSGRKTKGRVADVSPAALMLLTPERRTFSAPAVTRIRAGDPLRNGALIGGGVGIGLATWDYLIDPSEPGNAVIFTVAIGLGTAIGAGIDALITRVVYESPPRRVGVRLSPLVARDRRGIALHLRFCLAPRSGAKPTLPQRGGAAVTPARRSDSEPR